MRCIRRNQVNRLVVARGIFALLPRRIPFAFFILPLALLLSLTACSSEDSSVVTRGSAAPPAQQQETVAPIPTAMDTFRALAPPEGLRFTPLFNQPLSSDEARIKRLEDAVQTIRNDVDTLAPTMVRMVAIEKDIKGLVAQLQTLTDQNGQPAPAQQVIPAPAEKKHAEKENVKPAATKEAQQEAPKKLPPDLGGFKIPGEDVARGTEPAKALPADAGPKASSSLVTPEAASKGELPPEDAASPNSSGKGAANTSSGDIFNLRIADYPEKTRMVIDMTAGVKTPMHMSEDGKTLIIDISHLNWGGATVWDSDKVKLIIGGRVEEGNLYVNLKRPAIIKSQMLLPPSATSKHYRLVVDLGTEAKK